MQVHSTVFLSTLFAAVATATPSAQQAADTGLGFLDAQAAITAHEGVEHDGLTGLAVDGVGHYWVSVRRVAPNAPHKIVELDRQGNVLGVFAAPAATAGSAFGLRDGAYDAGSDRIYWGIDPAGGPQANLYCFDVRNRRFDPQFDIQANVVTGTLRGLAFDGTRFWAANFASPLSSFDTVGVQLSALPSPSDGLYGLGWHAGRGTLWGAGQLGLGDGSTQGGAFAPGVHVFEIDPQTGARTGDGFRADYLLPPGTDGVAGGCEVWQRNGQYVISVLVQAAPHDGIVELVVDADVGAGCGGIAVDYQGGNAWIGNPNFAVVTHGIASSASCAMLIGFDATTIPVPGITACPILANLALSYTVPRSGGGSHSLALPIPVGVPPIGVAFQAVELGPSLPLTLSQVLWISIVP